MAGLYFQVSAEELGKTVDSIIESIKDEERIKPIVVMADSPHASFLEYGTRGFIENPDKGYVSENGKSARESIEQWVDEKFTSLSKKEKKALSWSVYQKIMKYGIAPHPYLQPAMDQVLRSYKIRDWFEQGHTTWDLGQEIVERARDILIENSNNWHWDLYKSLKVREYTVVDRDI